MIGNIGPLEIGIVLVIALIVFGPKRLPELGHGLGRGIREFKGSVTGEDEHEVPGKGETHTTTRSVGATDPAASADVSATQK